MNNSNKVTKVSLSSHIRTPDKAKQRIINYRGHAVTLLEQLQKQNAPIVPQNLNLIYEKAQTAIEDLNRKIQENLSQISPEREKKIASLIKKRTKLEKEAEKNPSPETSERLNAVKSQLEFTQNTLSKKEIKKLKKDLVKLEEEIVSIIHQSQIDAVSEIAAAQVKEQASLIKDKAAALAKGGWGAGWIRFLSLVSSTNSAAIGAFQKAQEQMIGASKQAVEPSLSESQLDQDRRAEFESYAKGETSLDKRAGVIGMGGIYRIQVSFSKVKIQKQLSSFIAQNLGEAERSLIEREIDIDRRTYTIQLIPLNKTFDLFLALRGTLTGLFSTLFGTKGISSTNRHEAHLVNGYETNLLYKGKPIFRALRHAIASDRNQKDPEIRAQNSRKAAEELLKAALLQEIAGRGLTLEQAQKQRILLNLNSVSLVTPDDLRPYLPGQHDERKMLLDQIIALESLKDQRFLEVDGLQIPVKVNVNAFNFGVNYATKSLGWGLGAQYAHNLKALAGLRAQSVEFDEMIDEEMLKERITNRLGEFDTNHTPSLNPAASAEKVAELNNARTNARNLMNDIEDLMKDKKAYLKEDNQYEIGAKILNLSNLMDQTSGSINLLNAKEEQIPGFKAAFNCMSGKDRTGIMDGVAKAFAIMAIENSGHYPTHEELKKEPERTRFAQILVKVLLHGGSLDITEINSGAKGYKVGNEARLFGVPIQEFLQMQGFSSITPG